MVINRGLIAETGNIPGGMQLIQDTWEFKIVDKKEVVTEGANGGEEPAMRVTGLFQQADHKNANGRIYPYRILRGAVDAIQEDVKARAVLGEYDHPCDAKIHLDRVSHVINKLWMDGKKVYGEAEILHRLPLGACLRGLFEHKVRVGISSRGVGDLKMMESDDKTFMVAENFAFVTWDAVAEPSVSGAILNLREGVEKKFGKANQTNKFTTEVYQNLLVREINKFFGLK